MTKEELKDFILSLPPLPDIAPEFTWLNRRITLRRRILEDDLDKFLEWSVIKATMNTDPVYQDYHLNIWEKETGLKVSSLNSIVEFGGGYGAMIKQIYKRGFKGQYHSCDFPELLGLQMYYNPDIKIIADIPAKADLMIAICSLSEADLLSRNAFLTSLEFDHHLIRYQYHWDGIDNHLYFNGMEGKRFRDKMELNHWYLVR